MQMNKQFTQEIPRFGKILKAYRAENKIFLSDLSRQWKVSKSTLSRIENEDVVPSTHIVLKLLELVMPEFSGKIFALDASSDGKIASQGPWMNKFKGRPRD